MFVQFDHLQKLGRDNFDLGLKLFGATNSVAQAITQEIAEYSRRALQQSASACEKLAESKTLDAAMDVQSDHAKAALDDLVAQSKRMGELYQSLAKNAAKSVEAALTKYAVDQAETAAAPEATRTDAKAGMSAVAGQAGKPAERNVVRDAVASAVKQAVDAARQAVPSVN